MRKHIRIMVFGKPDFGLAGYLRVACGFPAGIITQGHCRNPKETRNLENLRSNSQSTRKIAGYLRVRTSLHLTTDTSRSPLSKTPLNCLPSQFIYPHSLQSCSGLSPRLAFRGSPPFLLWSAALPFVISVMPWRAWILWNVLVTEI
jgi:hypothetical protein